MIQSSISLLLGLGHYVGVSLNFEQIRTYLVNACWNSLGATGSAILHHGNAVRLVLAGWGVLILARRPEVEADMREGLMPALERAGIEFILENAGGPG